jgi:hypothetical protein
VSSGTFVYCTFAQAALPDGLEAVSTFREANDRVFVPCDRLPEALEALGRLTREEA